MTMAERNAERAKAVERARAIFSAQPGADAALNQLQAVLGNKEALKERIEKHAKRHIPGTT